MYFRSAKKLSNETSLDEPIDQDGDGNALSFMDILSTTDCALESIEQQDCFRVLHLALQQLSPKEQTLLSLRYGLNGTKPQTQREVAKQFGISRSYISRLEKKALEHLRYAFEHMH